MAGTFPTLSTGSVCMYPTSRSVSAACRILTTESGLEQRFRTAPFLSSWELQFNRLSLADLDSIRAFFETQKGAFDSTWVFPFDGTNYSYLCFDSDELIWQENRLNRFDVSVKIRQTKKSGTYATSGTPSYPTINGGVITQLPASYGVRYLTTRNDLETGLRDAWSERDDPLKPWVCEYPAITASEANQLLDFFTAMGGCYKSFTFTDPVTAATFTARFSQDKFTRKYVSYGVNSVTLQVEQVSA